MELNEFETKVLQSLIISSMGNGHDFGFIEDAEQVLDPPESEMEQIRFNQAIEKFELSGMIQIHEKVGGHNWTQFNFPFDKEGLNPDPSHAINLIVGF